MSKLLIEEPPLQVLPTLAQAIGLNEAIILQQIHYWLQKSQHEHDGRRWIYNTYEQWQEQLPFWSIPTIRRALESLTHPYQPPKKDKPTERDKRPDRAPLVLVANYNKAGFDKTLWYTIDYEELERLEGMGGMIRRCDQNDQTMRSSRSDGGDQDDHTYTRDYQKEATENKTTATELTDDQMEALALLLTVPKMDPAQARRTVQSCELAHVAGWVAECRQAPPEVAARLAIARLRDRIPPPSAGPGNGGEQDRRRYITGELAAFVEH